MRTTKVYYCKVKINKTKKTNFRIIFYTMEVCNLISKVFFVETCALDLNLGDKVSNRLYPKAISTFII